jgi:hypothetical protein
MNRRELLRRRRCRALQLAAVLGVLLPLFQPSWINLGAAAGGLAVIGLLYRRECRRGRDTDPTRSDTHP